MARLQARTGGPSRSVFASTENVTILPKVPPDPQRRGACSCLLATNTLRAIPVIPETPSTGSGPPGLRPAHGKGSVRRRSLDGADLEAFRAAWLRAIDAHPTR